MKKKILIIHGPNLNMLGRREPETYGRATLEEINAALATRADKLGVAIETFHSNHEGEIVERIQAACDGFDTLIINPAAYTHTSIAIRDALLLMDIPIIEVHLSNIHKREDFRKRSLISDIATGHISGLGINGYLLALDAAVDMIKP